MLLLLVTLNTKVKVLANCTVPPRFHLPLAHITCVDERVPARVVYLVQHGDGAELRTAQSRELPVFLPGHGEEGVAAVHEIA